MKRLASFLMIGVFITSFTWAQATIPDTKENSKTELLTKAKTVKMESFASIQFVIHDQSVETKVLVLNENHRKNSTLYSIELIDVYKVKLLKSNPTQIFNYRKARDGI